MWSHSVAGGRYVDDVVWLSRSLCAGCLTEGIAQAYSVPFETEPPLSGKLVWLDFVICLQCTNLEHCASVGRFRVQAGAQGAPLRTRSRALNGKGAIVVRHLATSSDSPCYYLLATCSKAPCY